ncbi:hypothetical protein pb186bvf_015682 [Paramecium bursaria]
MSKLVDFILKNQNNMVLEVEQNIIGLFYIRDKLIIIKPSSILIDHETRFEIRIDKILDVIELQNKTYILAANEDQIMLIIYEEEIKYFYKSLSLKYSQLLINSIEDEQLMIMDCLIINDDLASILQINIFDYQIVELRQAKQILRFSKDQIMLINGDEYYILSGNEISEFDFQDRINDISIFNSQTYIQGQNSFYLIQDDQLIQTSLMQNSFIQNGLIIHISENEFEIDTQQGQIYYFQTDQQFSNKDQFILQMRYEYPIVYVLSQQSLYQIYYPDYQLLIEQQFKQENHIRGQKQLTIDISQNEELLFNHIKKNKTIIDDMINLCLRKGYLKPLLLLNARIRVYTTFFDQVIKTQNIRDVQKLIDYKIFKQCEIFEKQNMHEEFIECALKYQKYDSIVYFIKYLTENPQYIPEHQYLEILQIPFNRQLYLEKQLTPPNIPVYGFKMQLYRIKLLKQARQLCYHDYYRIKAEYIEMYFIQKQQQIKLRNEWIIDEQMLELWQIIYRKIVDSKISEM